MFGVAEIDEDVLEELERDLLGLGDPFALHGPVVRHRELEQGADRVVDLGRDAHDPIVLDTGDGR